MDALNGEASAVRANDSVVLLDDLVQDLKDNIGEDGKVFDGAEGVVEADTFKVVDTMRTAYVQVSYKTKTKKLNRKGDKIESLF